MGVGGDLRVFSAHAPIVSRELVEILAAPSLELAELGDGVLDVPQPLLEVGPPLVDLAEDVLELGRAGRGARRRGR